METVTDFIFLGSKITADGECNHEIKRYLLLGRKAMTNLDSILKNRDITNKTSQSYDFSSSHVWMWELDCKQSWAPTDGCFWTSPDRWMLLNFGVEEDSWEPLGQQKGNQSWIFIGRTGAEAETSILWPPDAKKWFIGKDPDAEKDWRQEEKGTTEDEMVGWHHQLNGHEFEQALGISDRQGWLARCSPWGLKESDKTEWLDWTELNWSKYKSSVWNLKIKTACL